MTPNLKIKDVTYMVRFSILFYRIWVLMSIVLFEHVT